MIQTYDLRFNTGSVKPHVIISQYDTSRIIRFILGFEPTSAELKINGTTMECLVDGNIVEFSFQSTMYVGKWEAEIRCDGNGSVNFVLEVEETPIGENTTVIRNMSLPSKTPLEEPKISLNEDLKEIKEIETDLKEVETDLKENKEVENKEDTDLKEETDEEVETKEAEDIGFLNEKEKENETDFTELAL